jgi:hypothetical protein
VTAPDFVEPIVGYRAWRLDRDALVPWSAGRAGAGAWTPGVNQATCLHTGAHPSQSPPVADCSCGLYALADPRDERLRPSYEAVGAVVAWGDVEVHATGFRAQYAAIVALGLPDDAELGHLTRLREAARRYGVPAVPIAGLAAAALEYGRPIAFESILVPRRRAITIHRTPPPPLGVDGASGIALDEHLTVTVERGGVRLAPAPPLAEVLKGMKVSATESGTTLGAGDVIARAGGADGFVLRTPVGGVVGPDPGGGGPAGTHADAGIWLAPTRWEDDAAAITWGAAGRRFYAAEMDKATARDADPFASLRTRWLHAHARIRSAEDVLDELRRERARPRFASRRELDALLVERLRVAFEADGVISAARRLERRMAWRLHAPEADVALGAEGVATAPPRGGDLVLHASAETADDYFAGRIDLPAALRRREVQTSSPYPAVLRAASIMKPLHAAYVAALA